MKYDITYSCGHVGEVNLLGPGKERERKIWYYENHRVCPECEQKAREEANRQAAKLAAERSMPELCGSEKQVAWANRIRECVRTAWEELRAELEEDITKLSTSQDDEKNRMLLQSAKQFQGISYKTMDFIFKTKADASWWIDARCYGDIMYLIRRVYDKSRDQIEAHNPEREKAEETDVQANEAKAEATLRPDGDVRGIAQVRVEEDKVIAVYPKDKKFRSIVKDKKYCWDADNVFWYRNIGITTGSASDRAAELINALLRSGFAVMCFDASAREMAVSGDWKPECERWILRAGDGEIKAVFPRDERINEHVRKAGGRWKSDLGAYVIPAAQIRDIEELARLDGFCISPKAHEEMGKALAVIKAAKVVTPAEVIKSEERDGLHDILESSREVLPDLVDDDEN